MKIKGKVYKKRTYLDQTKQEGMNISFLELDECIKLNGDLIKFIPIFGANFNVGEKIEMDGVIRNEYIITSMGKRSYEPVPAIRVV
jgi:hypothetical protein